MHVVSVERINNVRISERENPTEVQYADAYVVISEKNRNHKIERQHCAHYPKDGKVILISFAETITSKCLNDLTAGPCSTFPL